MNKTKAVALLSRFIPLLSQIQGSCSGGAMDDQQRKSNGQFGSGGGGGSAAKGGKKAAKITSVAFAGQMNQKSFHPTNAQLTAISKNTQETVGRASLSIGMLNQHDLSAGTGTINHEGKTYKVHRLASNNKWYVTG